MIIVIIMKMMIIIITMIITMIMIILIIRIKTKKIIIRRMIIMIIWKIPISPITMAICRSVVYFAQTTHAFSAGIKSRHCRCNRMSLDALTIGSWKHGTCVPRKVNIT